MPTSHIVAQGEHLSSIANQYGFTDFSTIWDDPNNAQLKQQRVNPNVLLAGDTLYIPDKQEKDESGPTTKRHVFLLKQKRLMLRLTLTDCYEKPIANASCTLFYDQQQAALTSDANGKIEQVINPDTTAVSLVIGSEETPYKDDMLSLRIGDLDPEDTLSGQAARLNNLGYLAGTPKAATDPQFTSAVEEFQCEHDLTVDGQPGPQTQSRLKQVHGC